MMKTNPDGLFNSFSPLKTAFHILRCTLINWPGRYMVLCPAYTEEHEVKQEGS